MSAGQEPLHTLRWQRGHRSSPPGAEAEEGSGEEPAGSHPLQLRSASCQRCFWEKPHLAKLLHGQHHHQPSRLVEDQSQTPNVFTNWVNSLGSSDQYHLTSLWSRLVSGSYTQSLSVSVLMSLSIQSGVNIHSKHCWTTLETDWQMGKTLLEIFQGRISWTVDKIMNTVIFLKCQHSAHCQPSLSMSPFKTST